MLSHSVENRRDPSTSAKSGGPRQPDIPRKERPLRPGHKRNCQFQLSSQSFIPGFLLTMIRPQPQFLSILAPIRTVVHLQLRSGLRSKEGLDRCRREWNRQRKNHPPALVPGSKCPLPIGDPSIARPARCPERPVRSRRGGWGPCTAPTPVQHSLSDHHQSKNSNANSTGPSLSSITYLRSTDCIKVAQKGKRQYQRRRMSACRHFEISLKSCHCRRTWTTRSQSPTRESTHLPDSPAPCNVHSRWRKKKKRENFLFSTAHTREGRWAPGGHMGPRPWARWPGQGDGRVCATCSARPPPMRGRRPPPCV